MRRIFLLLLFIGGNSAWALQDSADLTRTHTLVSRARTILCQLTFCVQKNVRVDIENYRGFHGYYHIEEEKITISPDQSDVSQLLSLVHEFVHVYRSQFNRNEETWLNEGLAKFIEYKVSTIWPESYHLRLQQSPQLYFENSERRFTPQGAGYSDSFWLVYYLHQRFGGDRLISKLLQSTQTGWPSVVSAIAELQTSGLISPSLGTINQDFILRHLAMALLLNDPYAAKFSLFYIGPQFQPLNLSEFNEDNEIDPELSESAGLKISRQKPIQFTRLTYAVESLAPLKIKEINSTSNTNALYYISIQ